MNPQHTGVPHTVRLRKEAFTKATGLAGFRSDYALARAMGVNRSTVTRVLTGHLHPGPAFIGGALTALAPMQFNDLFQVVPTS
ncbi:transcriptional regulator [Saccharothrix xinjiangensis]|uniref:Transcriptional regulator n=1 Tax=Saccharothrix xinjiangensis TaxID=204798 RepID=A0ABV9YAH2_9PSEU